MCGWFYVFFFKQKTAYEMRISDWSSDVCSSDLISDVALVIEQRASIRMGKDRNASSGLDGFKAGAFSAMTEIHSHAGRIHACDQEIGRASCRERVCQYV